MPNSIDECVRAGETCVCVGDTHAAVRYRRILGTSERESSSFLMTRDTR